MRRTLTGKKVESKPSAGCSGYGCGREQTGRHTMPELGQKHALVRSYDSAEYASRRHDAVAQLESARVARGKAVASDAASECSTNAS